MASPKPFIEQGSPKLGAADADGEYDRAEEAKYDHGHDNMVAEEQQEETSEQIQFTNPYSSLQILFANNRIQSFENPRDIADLLNIKGN